VRLLLDTNVVISGIFFGGSPGRLIKHWLDGRFEAVVTPLILDEYRSVSREFSRSRKELNVDSLLDALAMRSLTVEDRTIPSSLCRDPDDEIFVTCALSTKAAIVSGDKDLKSLHGEQGLRVLSPAVALRLIDE
jgi:uncharacterized protein